MYNSKFPLLVEHLIDEHQLLLLDSEIQLIDYLIDKDLKIRKMKDNNNETRN